MGVVDDELTPTRPWSVGIQLAELASAEVGDIVGVATMPDEATDVIAVWLQRAVRRAVEPERQEVDRLRAELEVAEEQVDLLRRDLGRLRALVGIEDR